ncbi:MAG: flagellar basal body P-ring protein FlgI [Proteobacteria bacterium]|nr:flagellar basal body P-ring protein FlgI [Pseudomonadota bacterium]NOG58925.1 flagellar basal body P-ring protein FlgI [Pseudomonadota bacterium]
MKILKILFVILFLFGTSLVQAERIKDIANIAGVRDNQLIGYGLVVGLDGTGDTSTPFTTQSLQSMLKQFGISLDTVPTSLKNVAAAVIHATLPPFAKPGQQIDITVSSLSNAKSLRGGSLLISPLKGIDGNIYAIAQGNVVVGGFGVATDDGSSISVNVPSAGRIPNGAIIERSVPSSFGQSGSIVLNLHRPDFTTANRMADAINEWIGLGTAQAIDGTSVNVTAPDDYSQRVAFASLLENITFEPGSAPARVIVNSRTGTVVISQHVTVDEAAVSHGSLIVTITEDPIISQPGAFSDGTTTVVPSSDISIEQEDNRMFLFNPGVSLDDLVRAVNQVGAAPGDLVAILEALKESGALRAELIII